jgi:hypothetical protein
MKIKRGYPLFLRKVKNRCSQIDFLRCVSESTYQSKLSGKVPKFLNFLVQKVLFYFIYFGPFWSAYGLGWAYGSFSFLLKNYENLLISKNMHKRDKINLFDQSTR